MKLVKHESDEQIRGAGSVVATRRPRTMHGLRWQAMSRGLVAVSPSAGQPCDGGTLIPRGFFASR